MEILENDPDVKRNLIVVGRSAGSLEVLRALAAGLPVDLDAAVLVVVHVPASVRSVLPQILARSGPLPAAHAVDGEPIIPGRILIAPPDHHLLVRGDRVRVSRGPQENGHRPAVDPLFRTAARWAGPRVVGVIVSGMLDDGAAGMVAVRARGGFCVVQSPADATYPGMPQSAVEYTRVDRVVAASELAAVIVAATREELPEVSVPHDPTEETAPELDPPGLEPEIEALRQDRDGAPSGFSCPDCHGVLWEIRDGELTRYRCRVGHAFSPESLLAYQDESVEEAMWVAYRALEESAAIADRARQHGNAGIVAAYEQKRSDALARAHLIRRALGAEDKPEPLP